MATLGNANEPTLWEGRSEGLANAALGGRGAPSYRLTPWHLYWERGLITTDAQQVALLSVGDVDVKQSMTQKARGLGDVIVHAGAQSVTVEHIRNPRDVRDRILAAVHDARRQQMQAQNTYTHQGGQPPHAQPAPAGGGTDEVMALLRQLGELRDAGVLSPEEFEAKKAELLARL